MTSFFLKSQGCPTNVADAHKIAKYLESQGHKIVKTIDEAEEIIITTCGFNEKKLKNSIKELNSLKELFGNKLHIAGCIPKIRPEYSDKYDIVATPKDFSGLNKFSNKINKKSVDDFSPSFLDKDVFYIRISTGCSGKCSFCAIKQATGFTTSRSINEIVKDLRNASKKYKKIALISEDIGSWGIDIKLKLSDLLKELVNIKGDFKILLSSIHPKNILRDPKIIDLFSHPKIGETLYLANQSASNKMLELMNREYTIEEYNEILKKITKIRPDLKLQTDLLVGFPEESEEDHKKNIEFVKNTNINFLQVFMYTPMKKTISNKFKDLPEEIKIKRAREIIDLFLEKNKTEKRLILNTNIDY